MIPQNNVNRNDELNYELKGCEKITWNNKLSFIYIINIYFNDTCISMHIYYTIYLIIHNSSSECQMVLSASLFYST